MVFMPRKHYKSLDMPAPSLSDPLLCVCMCVCVCEKGRHVSDKGNTMYKSLKELMVNFLRKPEEKSTEAQTVRGRKGKKNYIGEVTWGWALKACG